MDFDKMLKDRTLFVAAIGIAIVMGNYAMLGIANLVFQVTEAPRTIKELFHDPVLHWALAQLALAISITVIAFSHKSRKKIILWMKDADKRIKNLESGELQNPSSDSPVTNKNTKTNPPKNNTELKFIKNDKWEFPKLAKITTGGILILMIGIGCWAWQIHEGVHNITYTMIPQNVRIPFYTLIPFELLDNNTENSQTIRRYIVIEIALHAKSFSAQAPIEVQAISEPLTYITKDEFDRLPDSIFLFFPDSLKDPPENLGGLSYNIGYSQLFLNKDTKRYEGSDQIKYQYQSKGGYYFRTPYNLEEDVATIIDHPDGTTTISIKKTGDLRKLVLNATEFPIEPTSSTINLQMNTDIQAISILVIDIGLIQSRKQIILGVACLYRNILRVKVGLSKKIRTLRLSNKS